MIRKILFSVVFLTAFLSVGEAGEGASSSQDFTPARYAWVAAESHAAVQQSGTAGPVMRKVALKLDTRTG